MTKIQIADAPPVRKNQDRNKEKKHGKNPVSYSKTGEFMVRKIGYHKQNKGCREKIFRSFPNIDPIAASPCTCFGRKKR